MTTVDPNAPKPPSGPSPSKSARRRAAATSVDPRTEDASGSVERGSGRARGKTKRSVNDKADTKDPLARLAALEDVWVDADEQLPDVVPAERPSAKREPTTDAPADAPAAPFVRPTSVDASIPTGTMASVTAPAPPAPPSPTSIVVPPVVSPEPTEAVPVIDTSMPPRQESRSVIWRRTGRPRVRRVTRVLRHIDTWSVFKVALVFNMVGYLVTLTSAVLLWNVAYRTGTIDNVEKFFEQFGWSTFEFRGGELYHNLWIAGLFVAIGLTGFVVMLATLFNLITDLVGGIRVSVLEEEVITKASQRPAGDTAPETPPG